MSALTSSVRKVVGSGTTTGGRGMSWMCVGDRQERRGYKEQQKVIDLMIQNFPCWKMQREVSGVDGVIVDFHFFVSSKRGKEYGVCHMNEMRDTDNERLIIINYCYLSHDDIHQHNRNYRDVISYERIN